MELTNKIESLKPLLGFNHLLIPELLNINNPSFEDSDLKILVFLDSLWEVRSCSETLNALYDICKKSKYKVFFDFCYKLHTTDYEVLPSYGKYFGYASKRTPDEFDMIWISVSYLGDLPYVINFLHNSNLKSPFHSLRKDEIKSPLIMLGGCIATACDLVSEYIDMINLGEGENRLTLLIDYYVEEHLKTKTILDRIKSLCDKFDNCGYPMGWEFTGTKPLKPLYPWVKRAKFYRDFDTHPTLYTYKLLMDDDVSVNRTNILIGKGCVNPSCTFCVEGYEHGIWREYDLEYIKQGMLEIKKTKPVETLILYAFNTNCHSKYPEIFSIGSSFFNNCISTGFRGDICSEDENLVKLLVASGNNRVGLGVEGISDRIRNDILGKRFFNEQILQIARRCIDTRINHLKFNMIFTGYEESEDFDEFESLLRKIEAYRKLKRRENFRVTLSFTTLVHYNTVPMGRMSRKALNIEFSRKTLIKDFSERLSDITKIHFKYNTGSENMLLQLFNDYGRLLAPFIEKYFSNSVKTLTRKYYSEIVNDIIESPEFQKLSFNEKE